MDTIDYNASADTIGRLVQARRALVAAILKTDALLGLPPGDETVAPGNAKSTAAALADAQRKAQGAADLLRSLGTVHAALSDDAAAVLDASKANASKVGA